MEARALKKAAYTIAENLPVARAMHRMRLEGPTDAFLRPGQFAHIAIPGFYLRRPISACDWDEQGFTILYKLVGEGTRALAALPPGTVLDALTGLGNGYAVEKSGARPLLVGGGAGVPPLYALCKALLRAGRLPTVCLGFNRADEIILLPEFQALGCEVLLATADGSAGARGFVTDALAEARPDCDYLFACGPEQMLRAVYFARREDGQFSFEERMACGIGACMGCSCQTKYGSKRICADGPVLNREEIIW